MAPPHNTDFSIPIEPGRVYYPEGPLWDPRKKQWYSFIFATIYDPLSGNNYNRNVPDSYDMSDPLTAQRHNSRISPQTPTKPIYNSSLKTCMLDKATGLCLPLDGSIPVDPSGSQIYKGAASSAGRRSARFLIKDTTFPAMARPFVMPHRMYRSLCRQGAFGPHSQMLGGVYKSQPMPPVPVLPNPGHERLSSPPHLGPPSFGTEYATPISGPLDLTFDGPYSAPHPGLERFRMESRRPRGKLIDRGSPRFILGHDKSMDQELVTRYGRVRVNYPLYYSCFGVPQDLPQFYWIGAGSTCSGYVHTPWGDLGILHPLKESDLQQANLNSSDLVLLTRTHSFDQMRP